MKISNPTAIKGEDLAAKFLRKRGYKIIERNFRKGYGEIDIIATEDNTLVFIEVKTRKSLSFGLPIESITPFKLKALEKTAIFYKQLHPDLPEGLRMDAVSVELDHFDNPSKIELIKNIFSR